MNKDEEIELLRMQLAACGVAALQNTETSVKERINKYNPCWTASYGVICNAVDREMALRAEMDKLVEAISQSIARSDDYGDSHCSQPIRRALASYRAWKDKK